MCVFCDFENIKPLIIRETEDSLVIISRFPLSKLGHYLIIPRIHLEEVNDLSDAQRNDIFSLLNDFIKEIRTKLNPAGLNVLINIGKAAGKTIGHLHIHVICRENGDGIANFGREKKDEGKTEITDEEIWKIKKTING